MHLKRLAVILALAGAVGSAAARQISVSPPIRVYPFVHGSQEVWAEVAIAASAIHPKEVLIGWNGTGDQSGDVLYSITLDGGQSFAAAALPIGPLPCLPQLGAVDVMAAASPSTGDLWIGALYTSLSAQSGFGVRRRQAGLGYLEPMVTAYCQSGESRHDDKGTIVVGPRRPNQGTGEKMYMQWTRQTGGCASYQVQMEVSNQQGSTPPGELWPNPPFVPGPGDPCLRTGTGETACVIGGNDPTLQGRVVLVDHNESNNVDLPWYTTNDFEGNGLWTPRVKIDLALVPGQTSPPYDPLSPIDRTLIPGTFSIPNFPSVAPDPTNPSNVYIGFAARAASTGDNTDICLAQSTNGGVTFDPGRVLHLTDAQLQQAPGSAQIQVSIVVDKFGGINILWYTVTGILPGGDQTTRVRAWWARIGAFAPVLPTRPVVAPLAPEFTPGYFIGHYNMIATAECFVYPGYHSGHEGTSNIYMNRIYICPADVDASGFVDSADAVAFGSAYVAAQPPADVNQDGVIDCRDITDFQTAFTCGCGPQP